MDFKETEVVQRKEERGRERGSAQAREREKKRNMLNILFL